MRKERWTVRVVVTARGVSRALDAKSGDPLLSKCIIGPEPSHRISIRSASKPELCYRFTFASHPLLTTNRQPLPTNRQFLDALPIEDARRGRDRIPASPVSSSPAHSLPLTAFRHFSRCFCLLSLHRRLRSPQSAAEFDQQLDRSSAPLLRTAPSSATRTYQHASLAPVWQSEPAHSPDQWIQWPGHSAQL